MLLTFCIYYSYSQVTTVSVIALLTHHTLTLIHTAFTSYQGLHLLFLSCNIKHQYTIFFCILLMSTAHLSLSRLHLHFFPLLKASNTFQSTLYTLIIIDIIFNFSLSYLTYYSILACTCFSTHSLFLKIFLLF